MNEDPLIAGTDSLTCSVSHGPGYVVVSVAGEIDAGTEQQFRDVITSALARGVMRVAVDLTAVTFLASAAIGVVMGVHRVLADEDGLLVLVSPKGEAAQVLSLTGVSEVIPVVVRLPDAVALLDC